MLCKVWFPNSIRVDPKQTENEKCHASNRRKSLSGPIGQVDQKDKSKLQPSSSVVAYTSSIDASIERLESEKQGVEMDIQILQEQKKT